MAHDNPERFKEDLNPNRMASMKDIEARLGLDARGRFDILHFRLPSIHYQPSGRNE
jgi:hypothetical protein